MIAKAYINGIKWAVSGPDHKGEFELHRRETAGVHKGAFRWFGDGFKTTEDAWKRARNTSYAFSTTGVRS